MGALTVQDVVDAGFDIQYTAAETPFPYRTICTRCEACVDTHLVTSGLNWAEAHVCRSGWLASFQGAALWAAVLVIGFAPSLWGAL